MKLFCLACLSVVFFSVSACHSPGQKNRDPQNLSEAELSFEEQGFENNFQNIMQEPSEEAKLRRFVQFLKTQLGIFDISQDLMEDFDAELARVYRAWIQSPKAKVNRQTLEQQRQVLHLAWEFSDSHLHEMQYMYVRLLEEANALTGTRKSLASRALSAIGEVLDAEWKTNRWAVISIAQELQAAYREFKKQNPQAKPFQFGQFLNLSKSQFQEAYRHRLQAAAERKKRHIDSLLAAQWDRFVQQRKQAHTKERVPQSVSIAPDKGPQGTVNGSHFKQEVWALTFDDGPHDIYTPQMMEVVRVAGYQGTFFWTSQHMMLFPEIARAAGELGMNRGSHSYTHANLPTLGPEQLKREITLAAEDFSEIIGSRPTFFRCPYGACNGNGSAIRQLIANNNMIHVSWNVDTLDWQDKNAESIFERTRKQMEIAGHGIVLFHDVHPQSVEAVKLLVAYLHLKAKWQVKTLSEIIETETGKPYSSP